LGTDERILRGIIYEDEEGEEVEELTGVELEAVFEKELEEKEMKKEMKATLPPKPKKLPDPFEGMEKTERQKLVKEQNREKRQEKMPKKVKKALIKKSSGKKTK
jgi:hypothetical protein